MTERDHIDFDEPHYGRWRPLVWFASAERILERAELARLLAECRRDTIPTTHERGTQ